MGERRWEITIVDQDSEDFEKDEITEYEARVTATNQDEAAQRAVIMIRERVAEVSGHDLRVTNMREIWKSDRPRP